MDENNTNDTPEEPTQLTDEQQTTNDIDNQTKAQNTPPLVVSKPAFYKTKPFRIIAAIIVLLAVGLIALLLAGDGEVDISNQNQTSTEAQKVTTLGATIVTIEGTVQYSQDGETWKDATGGESLAHLDYVRTLDASRTIVLFDDGSVTRLDSNTELYLSSLEVEGLEVTLIDGQIYSRVVESENQTFTVVTSNERFKALGTAYKTATDGTKDSLEVYQSMVKVESGDVDISEGNKYDTVTKEQSALDLAALETDEFAQWNKQKDSESDDFKDKLGVLKDKQPAPAPQPTSSNSSAGIVLSASQVSDGVKLTWSMNNASSTQGFKIVRSKSDTTPTYGENDAIYVSDASARSGVWYSDNGATHYYRVCIYFEGTCGTYSNVVQATSPKVEKEPVVNGGVTLSITGNQLSWSLSGGTAPHGYKIVLASTNNPVYPENSIMYVGAETMSATLPKDKSGTYFVRVCKYTNGTQEAGCVDYSNPVEYVVSGS